MHVLLKTLSFTINSMHINHFFIITYRQLLQYGYNLKIKLPKKEIIMTSTTIVILVISVIVGFVNCGVLNSDRVKIIQKSQNYF